MTEKLRRRTIRELRNPELVDWSKTKIVDRIDYYYAAVQIWTGLADSGCDEKPRWTKRFTKSCPLCSLYLRNDCKGCCLNLSAGGCLGYNHPYAEWFNSYNRSGRRIAARKVVNLIKKGLKAYLEVTK